MADIARRWDSDDLIDAKVLAASTWTPEGLKGAVTRAYAIKGPERRDAYRLLREANFYEDLALLHKEDVIELSTIERWIGDAVIDRWNYWWPTIQALRDDFHVDGGKVYANWQWLMAEVRVYRAGGGGRRCT